MVVRIWVEYIVRTNMKANTFAAKVAMLSVSTKCPPTPAQNPAPETKRLSHARAEPSGARLLENNNDQYRRLF